MKSVYRAAVWALVQIEKFKRKRQGVEPPFKPHEAKRVLVVSSTAIGDALFAVPGIKALRRLLPDATIDLLLRDKVAPLFRGLNLADDVLVYRGRYRNGLSLIKNFRRKNYDMCIVFHDSDPCPVEAAYAAGVPFIFRIGQKDEKCSHLLTFRVPYDNSKHAIDQRLEVLRRIFGTRLDDEDDFRMDIPVSPEQVAHYRNLLEERAGLGPGARHRFVAFQFSASGFYKEWPQGNFVELGKALIERDPGIFIVLIGGKGDRARAREIESAIKGATGKDRVLDLTGAIPIGELPAAMKAIDLLVTNDTGPLHVAIAVGTRTVSLFVSTNVEGTGPIQDRHLHTVMVKPKPCSPCVEKYCKDPHCMGLISPQEVYEAVVDSLKRLSDEGPSI